MGVWFLKRNLTPHNKNPYFFFFQNFDIFIIEIKIIIIIEI